MPQLVFVDGANTNSKIKLSRSVVLFNNKGSITLDNVGIPQIELKSSSGKFIISNRHPEILGMAINGEAIKQTVLKHGDLILLGDSMILFHEDHDQHQTKKTVFDSFESRIDDRLKPYKDASSVLDSFTKVIKSEQHKQLMLAYQINNLISTHFDLDILIQEVLSLLFKELGANRGFFFLRDESTKKLRIYHRLPTEREGSSDWSNTIIKEVLRRKESLLYVYNKDEEDILAGQSLVTASISSVLASPLILSKKGMEKKDKIIGIIQLDTVASSLRIFSENDLNFLNIIGSQVAAAIAQVRTFQKRKKYSENLVKLSRCNQFLSSHLTKDKIIKETVNSACKLLGCTKSSVVLFDRNFQYLFVAYAIGMDKKLWKTLKISPTNSLCGRVIQRREPLLITDHTKLPAELNFKPRAKYQTNSFLIIPIPASINEEVRGNGNQRKILGVICATDKMGGGSFAPHEQELLNIIATQTGIALANAVLYEKATIDALTKLYVRRYFFQKLEEVIAKNTKKSETVGLVMVDLDFFKKQNDTHGHQTGDVILKEFGSLLRSSLREQDIASRYGGEEFAVILQQATSKDCNLIAERVRQTVARFPFNQKQGPEIHMTVSIGLTCLKLDDDVDSLIARADKNLYEAKTGGRNRVIFK